MTISRSDLLDIIYRYYPRGVRHIQRNFLPPGEVYYRDTEQHLRLVEVAKRGRAEYSTWQAMYRRLGKRYSVQNESMSLLAGNADPAYSARIWVGDDIALSFHVSLLGPYYGIHLPSVVIDESVVQDVTREIEATYPGYQQIPPEIGDEIVPDVEAHLAFGEESVYICIFSDVWTWIRPA